MINRDTLYNLSQKHVIRGYLDKSLCLYNPKEVYEALTKNEVVVGWLKFIAYYYTPPPHKKVLLLYPCSTVKPYHMSRSYIALFKTLKSLGEDIRKLIHVVTISEPFGLIPEEYYNKRFVWYDCPGLFKWWCRKVGQPYEEKYVERSINILSKYISHFLKRTRNIYLLRIAFVRTFSSKLRVLKDHTHRRMIERASKMSDVVINLLPPLEVVKLIVMKRGAVAWDFYGVAHPIAQAHLKEFLLKKMKQLSITTRTIYKL